MIKQAALGLPLKTAYDQAFFLLQKVGIAEYQNEKPLYFLVDKVSSCVSSSIIWTTIIFCF